MEIRGALPLSSVSRIIRNEMSLETEICKIETLNILFYFQFPYFYDECNFKNVFKKPRGCLVQKFENT